MPPPARRTTGASPDSLTLYTCLSDESIQPVIAAFGEREDGGQVDLFRAPTGELNARVAADARSGGLRADVIWGCDPLTVQAFVDQDLGSAGGYRTTPRRSPRSSAPTTTSVRTALHGRPAPDRRAGAGGPGPT